MKKFLVAILVILSLLFVTPMVFAQVDVTPQVVSAKCTQDGCVLVWKATIVNNTGSSLRGNITVILGNKDKKDIVVFKSTDQVSLAPSQTKEISGTILLERSERSLGLKYLTIILENVIYSTTKTITI